MTHCCRIIVQEGVMQPIAVLSSNPVERNVASFPRTRSFMKRCSEETGERVELITEEYCGKVQQTIP